jgi:hypothetical protein
MTVDLAHGRAQFVSEQFKNTNTYTYEVKLRTEEPQCKDFQIVIKVRKYHFLVKITFFSSLCFTGTFNGLLLTTFCKLEQ